MTAIPKGSSPFSGSSPHHHRLSGTLVEEGAFCSLLTSPLLVLFPLFPNRPLC